MNYQSQDIEESRTSRRKKPGRRAADETFASLDSAGAARTRLIAEELIEQLTRAQIGEVEAQDSTERLDHLNVSLQLLAPAPNAQPNLSTITQGSKEAHRLVKDLEESVNGRRGQRAQRRAESSLKLAALSQSEAETILKEDAAKAAERVVPVADTVAVAEAPVAPAPKKVERKSLGSLLKQSNSQTSIPAVPPQESVTEQEVLPAQAVSTAETSPAPVMAETTTPEPEEVVEAVSAPSPEPIAIAEEASEEAAPAQKKREPQLSINRLIAAPHSVHDVEKQKISKANWQAAKEIAGGKESGALLLNIISEPERAMTDIFRQAKWALKKLSEPTDRPNA